MATSHKHTYIRHGNYARQGRLREAGEAANTYTSSFKYNQERKIMINKHDAAEIAKFTADAFRTMVCHVTGCFGIVYNAEHVDITCCV